MSHPQVVTLDHKSKPRVLFSGDKLVEVDLPPGTRVFADLAAAVDSLTE